MSDTVYYKIGTVAREFGISVGILHYYEREGLLTPEFVDPASGYRYYSDRQFEVLNTIRYLRTLDIPLDTIKSFLLNRDTGTILQMLREQEQVVVQKQRELEIIRRKISHRIDFLEDACRPQYRQCALKNVPARRIALRSCRISPREYFDLEQPLRELDCGQPQTAITWGKVGLQISRERLVQHDFSEYDSVFLILDEEDLYIGETISVPAQENAVIRFRGKHADAEPYYEELLDWIVQQKMSICGPASEITLIDNGITDDTDRFVTEIQIPVGR